MYYFSNEIPNISISKTKKILLKNIILRDYQELLSQSFDSY